jgi:hypothetical protein
MFRVVEENEVLYRGWNAKEALEVVMGNPDSYLETVDDVMVAPVEANPNRESLFETLSCAAGHVLRQEEILDKIGFDKAKAAQILAGLRAKGEHAVSVFMRLANESAQILSDSFNRAGEAVHRAEEDLNNTVEEND